MKVNIGPYRNWFGPYQLAEALCFWAKKEEDEYGFERTPDWVHNFGEILAHGSYAKDVDEKVWNMNRDKPKTIIYRFLEWVESKKKRKVKIKIDRWDTWSMDHTLALIILPMLKQLKATKHGSQIVELEDVPAELRADGHNDYDAQQCFDFYHEAAKDRDINYDMTHRRWDWVLDEMIFAFDHLVDDSWEDKYRSGEHDIVWVKDEKTTPGGQNLFRMEHGPKDTYKCDYDGLQKEWARVENGLRLFGKYYRGLWD